MEHALERLCRVLMQGRRRHIEGLCSDDEEIVEKDGGLFVADSAARLSRVFTLMTGPRSGHCLCEV